MSKKAHGDTNTFNSKKEPEAVTRRDGSLLAADAGGMGGRQTCLFRAFASWYF